MSSARPPIPCLAVDVNVMDKTTGSRQVMKVDYTVDKTSDSMTDLALDVNAGVCHRQDHLLGGKS